MFKQRMIIGVAGTVVAVFVLISQNILLSIAVAVITALALTELYNTLGYFKNNIFLAVLGYIVSFFILFLNMSDLSGNTDNVINKFILIIYVYICVLFVYMVLNHNKASFANVCLSAVSTIYITTFLMHIVLTKRAVCGDALIWLIFICAWITDTFAYFSGRFFGKHKLIESVSPKKTVEGAIGGVLGSVIFCVIAGITSQKVLGYNVNYLLLILLSIIGSVSSQFGDLAASCIKREQNMKDFGNILPGHGGIMDRFDSVILAAPTVYYFCMILPVIYK